ncbi:MAG: crossover junction endodeoxyribonuclease RuvC [Acidobacteriota bacterium]
MLVLGLDPGSRITGWGFVEKRGASLALVEAGVFPVPTREPMARRLAYLSQELTVLLARRPPAAVAVETPFHGRNSRSLVVLAQARGALLAAAGAVDCAVREYSPAEVKAAVTGNGRSDKQQVARMVRLMLGAGEGLAADATDALAVAICGIQRARIERISALGVRRK